MIKVLTKKYIIAIVILSIFLSLSCEKKEKKIDEFKKIEYKISQIIYSKKYKDVIKYIDSVYFTKNKKLSSKEKEILLFKQAEIKYLYLNKESEAYKEMKTLFKNNKLDQKRYIKLLSYLTNISEKNDKQNLGIFIEKLVKFKKEKTILYKYINFLKKGNSSLENNENYKKLLKIIDENTLLSKDEIILLKLDLMFIKKENKDKIIEFIKTSISSTKNQATIDKLTIQKIFYLEQQENINYKELLDILTLIKSKNYNNFKINKEKFYKNKISLYNKK